MGDHGAFEIFTGRVLENFKSKEHGSVKLQKGHMVTVLGVSADGDKYFGESGKQRGWFPAEYVLKTGVLPKLDDTAGVTDSPKPDSRAKRAVTELPLPDLRSVSADNVRTQKHTRGNSTNGEEAGSAGGGGKIFGLPRRATEVLTRKPSTPSPPIQHQLPSISIAAPSPTSPVEAGPTTPTKSSHPSPVGGGGGGGGVGGGAGAVGASARAAALERRKALFQEQGASGRMFLSTGPNMLGGGLVGGGGGGGGVGGGAVSDFVNMKKKGSLDSELGVRVATALEDYKVSGGGAGSSFIAYGSSSSSSVSRREIREKERWDKKQMKERKKDLKNARKHKKKAHKTKSMYFGVSLEETMQRQRESNPELQLPLLVTSLCLAITKLGGSNTEGIFRVSGTQATLDELKYQINKDNQVRIDDPHIATGLLKMYLGMLPEPLVPTNLQEALLGTVNVPQDSVNALAQLPEINRKVIAFLVQFLQEKIVPHEATTRMTLENLAMVIAPSLFSTSDDAQLGDVLRQTGQGIHFVINLLTTMKFDGVPLDFETDKKKVDVLIGLRGPKGKDKPKVKMGIASPRAKVEKKKGSLRGRDNNNLSSSSDKSPRGDKKPLLADDSESTSDEETASSEKEAATNTPGSGKESPMSGIASPMPEKRGDTQMQQQVSLTPGEKSNEKQKTEEQEGFAFG